MYFIPVLILLSSISVSLNAYIYGYTRLYRQDTHTTLDILYDVHYEERGLSSDDMLHKPLSEIRPQLFCTERYLLDALDVLNDATQPVTVVWECVDLVADCRPVFLEYGIPLVQMRCPNFNFYASDTWRKRNIEISDYILDQNSLLLELIDKDAITRISGMDVWHSFVELSVTVENKLLQTFYHFRDVMRSHTIVDYHPRAGLEFAELADIEMLSHILSTPDKKIVLYAGGTHAKNIQEFLVKFGHFRVAHSFVHEDYQELDTGLLAPLIDEPLSAASRTNYFFTRYAMDFTVGTVVLSGVLAHAGLSWVADQEVKYLAHVTSSVTNMMKFIMVFGVLGSFQHLLFAGLTSKK